MNRSIGYVGAFGSAQHRQEEVSALEEAGCEIVFKEAKDFLHDKTRRPQLEAALEFLRVGDELVLAKLDRLGSREYEVLACLNELQAQGIYIRTLDGLVNTEQLGEFSSIFIGLLKALSEVETSYLKERSRESIEFRKKMGGNLGGRPKTNKRKAQLVLQLRSKGNSLRAISSQTGLAVATIRRIIKESID